MTEARRCGRVILGVAMGLLFGGRAPGVLHAPTDFGIRTRESTAPAARGILKEPKRQEKVVRTECFAILGLVVATLALAVVPNARGYLDYGMHPIQGGLLPDAAFTQTGARVSLIEPPADPFAPSPVAGLNNAQWVVNDVLTKASHGHLTVLHMGSVFAGCNPDNFPTYQARIKGYADQLKAKDAVPYVYAVLGIDDSNSPYAFANPTGVRRILKTRKRVTSWLMSMLPGIKLRGHILHIGGWGDGTYGWASVLIGPDKWGFAAETVYGMYDYRIDGTTTCAYHGNPAPSPYDMGATANKIVADIDKAMSIAAQTYMGSRPIIFFPKAYYARFCRNNAMQEEEIACRFSDLWGRLKMEPLTNITSRDIRAFIPFIWHDRCDTFAWRGIEHSPQLKAAAAWVGSNPYR